MASGEWSAAEDERLRALWADCSLSASEIGRRLQRSKNSVVGRAHRLRLPARPSPILARGTTRALDDAQRQVVAGMSGQGYNVDQIARHLGVGRDQVSRAARVMELPGYGRRPPRTMNGAGVVIAPRASTGTLRAEAFRRHAQPGGGVALPGSVAQPIPAVRDALAGVPVRAGHPEASAGCEGLGVSSLDLPPAVVTPRPAVLSGRQCRWPMWGDTERATGEFCGAAVRRRDDGVPCVYCAAHAAKAFTRVVEAVQPDPQRITRGTFAWGGRAA